MSCFFTSGCCCTDLRRFTLVGVKSSTIPLSLPFSSRLFWTTCVLCFRDRNITMIGGLFSHIPNLCAKLVSLASMWFNPSSSLMITSTFSSQSFVVSRPLSGIAAPPPPPPPPPLTVATGSTKRDRVLSLLLSALTLSCCFLLVFSVVFLTELLFEMLLTSVDRFFSPASPSAWHSVFCSETKLVFLPSIFSTK